MRTRHRVAASIIATVCLAAATTAAAGAPIAPAPVITRVMPASYDAAVSYEAQSLCSPTPKPGTRALAALIRATYGRDQAIGMSRACGSGGTSEHKEGRALDWMTSVTSPRGRANAKAFLAWLLGPDAAGTVAGNATRLGVMYIGWNNRFWAAYSSERGWTELDNCLSHPASGDATSCHRNHIHISLTWDGASGRTSLWDGTPLAPFCESPRSEAGLAARGRAADVIAIDPVRVLATRDAIGLGVGVDSWGGWGHGDGGWLDVPVDPALTPAPAPTPAAVAVPCRLRPSGWRGDHGGILAKVTGQGGVPETGVAAAAVRVTAVGSTAPARIIIWNTGKKSGETIAKVRMNRNGRGSAIVPVASDGTIWLGTSAGGTDLNVDVVGYYLVGDQPNTTVARR